MTSNIVGAEYYTKIIEIAGQRIMIQAWDTSGEERFKSIAPTFIRKSMGVVLVYAVNDKKSFEDVKFWMEQIQDNTSSNVCILLVGSKIDLSGRVVDYDEAKSLADSAKITYFETSSRDGINVKEAFEALAKEIKEKILDEQKVETVEPVKIQAVQQKAPKTRKCC